MYKAALPAGVNNRNGVSPFALFDNASNGASQDGRGEGTADDVAYATPEYALMRGVARALDGVLLGTDGGAVYACLESSTDRPGECHCSFAKIAH